MVQEYIIGMMEEFTMENGRIIKCKEKDNLIGVMVESK